MFFGTSLERRTVRSCRFCCIGIRRGGCGRRICRCIWSRRMECLEGLDRRQFSIDCYYGGDLNGESRPQMKLLCKIPPLVRSQPFEPGSSARLTAGSVAFGYRGRISKFDSPKLYVAVMESTQHDRRVLMNQVSLILPLTQRLRGPPHD
jgi:hypothetical protein